MNCVLFTIAELQKKGLEVPLSFEDITLPEDSEKTTREAKERINSGFVQRWIESFCDVAETREDADIVYTGKAVGIVAENGKYATWSEFRKSARVLSIEYNVHTLYKVRS